MMERTKLQKILAVVFLTVLIWVWSDLAMDDTDSLSQIPVVMGNSSDPNLLVSFVDDAGRLTDHILVDTVDIKGPKGRLDQIKAEERTDSFALQLRLEPAEWDLTEPMEASAWPLVNFVRRSSAITNYGLSVDGCSPTTTSIRVTKLARRSLSVQCVDAYGDTIPANVTPPTINMYVPEAWTGDNLVALVELNASDLSRARGDVPIDAQPSVNIDGRIKTATQSVKVRLSEQRSKLKSQSIDQPKFCLVVDPVVQKDYKVVISQETPGMIHFRGTDEAKRAYQAEPYHVELVVERKDDPAAGQQYGTLKYRFPREYVEKKQIEPGDSPLTIDYKLVPREDASGGS